MSKSYKKSTISMFTLIVLLVYTNVLKAQVQNFSGNWTRNTEKTNAGESSINSVPIQIDVKQASQGISITRTSKNRQNDTTRYTEELKFDGSVTASVVKPNINKKASIKWSDNRKTFTETANYTNDAGNPIQKGEEIWSLSDDGKTLTIKSTLEVNGQSYIMTEVFDK